MIDLLTTSSSYSPLVFILPYSLTLTTVTCIPNIHSINSNMDSSLIPLVQRYSWEDNYTPSAIVDYTDEEKLTILKDFAAKLISNMHDVPSEFAEILSENFWELI